MLGLIETRGHRSRPYGAQGGGRVRGLPDPQLAPGPEQPLYRVRYARAALLCGVTIRAMTSADTPDNPLDACLRGGVFKGVSTKTRNARIRPFNVISHRLD
jgi:hypothetical protein